MTTFSSAFRGILFRCGALPSNSGNVRPQDGTDLLRNDDIPRANEDILHINLSLYVDNIVEYIAGWVARKLGKTIKCEHCATSLINTSSLPNRLITIKRRRNLVSPSPSVLSICRMAESVFRTKERWGQDFVSATIRRLLGIDLFPQLGHHDRNTVDGIDSHQSSLIRLIVSTYFNLRQNHNCKLRNLQLQRSRMRSMYNTLLHYHYHQ